MWGLCEKRQKTGFPCISEIHRGLYRALKSAFNTPSRIAINCYREALAIARPYLGNGANGRIPRVRRLGMWLVHGQGYRIRDSYVEIVGGHNLRIVWWDRRYDAYENRGARLVYRDYRMLLMIAKRIPRPGPVKPRGVLAVDVNEEANILWKLGVPVKDPNTAREGCPL